MRRYAHVKFIATNRDLCERLADLSDTLIRDVQDSLILQPAYLDIATTKRKADEVKISRIYTCVSVV